MRKEIAMATYYIGEDVHGNNTAGAAQFIFGPRFVGVRKVKSAFALL